MEFFDLSSFSEAPETVLAERPSGSKRVAFAQTAPWVFWKAGLRRCSRKKSWESKVPPPKATPAINKALLRDYENPLVSLNKALLWRYFLGGVALGGVP